jgi:PPOX class probable F420-dependent enzyme
MPTGDSRGASASPPTSLTALGPHPYVSLTTFRRTGEPVSTPVWVVPDGDALLVTTESGTGKVKRLRHTPRVELRPCSARGALADGAPVAVGQASVLTDDASVERLRHLMGRKYGLQYRVFSNLERLSPRRRPGERVVLRITAPSGEPPPAPTA